MSEKHQQKKAESPSNPNLERVKYEVAQELGISYRRNDGPDNDKHNLKK